MNFHVKSLVCVGRSTIRVFSNVGCAHLFCTLSSLPQEEFSSFASNQGGKRVEFGKDSDFNILIGKIRAGSSEDDVFQSLLQDRACNRVQISHSLLDKLLHRFKDEWKSALGVFRWAQSLPGYEPLPESYDKVVDTLGKMKQMEKMNTMVEEMRERNLVSLNTIGKVMRRLSGAGKWKEAVQLFDELETFGLDKNTESMNLLLDTLCKDKKVEHAREIFLELKSSIPPNVSTFNIFIHGWCNYKKLDEAYSTIEEMKGYGCRPCVFSYSTIIQSYCKQSNFRRVYELLDEMEAEGCPPNVVTFTTIMCSLTKLQEYDEAIKIVERMRLVGCKPDTLFYNTLIHALRRAWRLKEAIRVFNVEMAKNGVNPDTSTYNAMIATYCHHGQERKALECLQDMENSSHCTPDVHSYGPLLKLCFKSWKSDAYLSQMLDDMVNKHHLSLDLSTYMLLIHGLCRVGKCEWAYALFEEMIGKGIEPSYQTCLLLWNEIKQRNMYYAAESIESFMKNMKSL